MDRPEIYGRQNTAWRRVGVFRRSGSIQNKGVRRDKSRVLYYIRKWESRSRSCPRRFSAGHSNQDWSESATQWQQISSGISVTHRGMVAGAGQLCAWITGFCGSLRREWRGLRVGRDADRIHRHVACRGRHVVRSGGRRFWVPNSSSAAYRRIVVNNCSVYGDRQLSDLCRRSVIKRARTHML